MKKGRVLVIATQLLKPVLAQLMESFWKLEREVGSAGGEKKKKSFQSN